MILGFVWILACETAAANTPAAVSASPTPVATPAPYVSIEEEASPNYDGEGGSSTQINWAGQIPVGNGYLLRLKYPVVTSAPAEAVTGAGDLALYGFKVLPVTQGQWLAGFTVRVPSAQDTSLGSGKYSLGPALSYQVRRGPWTLGFFTQDYFSVMGPSSRTPVGKSKIEPVLRLALPYDWNIGLSSMGITYDWVLNRWTEVPVGFRVAKRIGSKLELLQPLRPLEAALEAEQNLSDVHDAPGWTTRLSFRWTF